MGVFQLKSESNHFLERDEILKNDFYRFHEFFVSNLLLVFSKLHCFINCILLHYISPSAGPKMYTKIVKNIGENLFALFISINGD